MAVSTLNKDIVVLDKSNISVTINASGTAQRTWTMRIIVVCGKI